MTDYNVEKSIMKDRTMVVLYGTGGVLDITKKSASTIWRWERDGLFPQRHQIGPRSVAWYSDEVDQWLQNPAEFNSTIRPA